MLISKQLARIQRRIRRLRGGKANAGELGAVWRGTLADGCAVTPMGVRSAWMTDKYRDELRYWVELDRGESLRLFNRPYKDVFRDWQTARMVELASFLDLPDLAALGQWASTRSSVEIGAGPFPSSVLTTWRRAVAIDPLSEGYALEGLLPPECDRAVYIASSAEMIPLPQGFADIFVAENCLDHVDRPGQVLKEARRILKSGGYLWLLVDLMAYSDHMHPNPFSETRLRALLQEMGFRVVHDRVSDHKSHPQATGEYRGLLASVG